MEHYVLCVWNGAFTDEDINLLEIYFNTLFPTTQQYQYTVDSAKEVAILLKPASRYIAVVNTCQNLEKKEWKEIEGDIKSLILEEVNNIQPGELSNDIIEQLSGSLHTLADQLPAFGTYKLDVLIGSNVLKDLSVSKEPLLSNAFFRLVTWHSAFFSIFSQKEFDQDRIDEWCEIINAQILHSESKLELGAPLWRGAVHFNISNHEENVIYQGFELKLDFIENEHAIFFHPVREEHKQVNSDHIVLSPKLQFVDEISFASVPPYMLAPVAFRLHTGKPNILNENTSHLTDYVLSNKEAALVMKLEYAEINEKIKPERKYCTSRWQRAVASGCFKDPECFVTTSKNYITFVVTRSRKSNHILAYPLRDTKCFNENFYFNIMNYKNSFMSSHVSKKRFVNKRENILSKVPYIEASDFQKINEKYIVWNMNRLKTDSAQWSVGNNCDSLSVWEDIKQSSIYSLNNRKKADLFFEELDPSDWPERIHLLRKQMQNEKKKVSESAVLGQNLKLPQQSFSISSSDISQYFLSSGEPKNSNDLVPLNLLNMDHFTNHDIEEVLHMNWPEVMNCGYHDLYYNSSCQTEDKESLGSQMVNLYIQHETASSCNKQQIIQSFSITVPEKNISPKKELKSPSCRQTTLKLKRSIRDCDTSKESIKDLLTKKVLFSSQATHSQMKRTKFNDPVRCSPRKKNTAPTRCSPRKRISVNYNGSVRHSPRKKIPVAYSSPVRCSPRNKYPINSNGPIRCSPRKKTSLSNSIRRSPRRKSLVNYKDPSTSSSSSRNGDYNRNSNKSKSQMPDLLRKKVRSAVATALENNGIGLSHSFYQPCGSKLFAICQTFIQDLTLKKGKTSEYLQKIADANVKQVIEFFKD